MREKHRFQILSIICLFLIFIYCRPAYAAKTNLRVAINCSLPPFQFINEKGKPDGMHIEILDIIAKRNNFDIQYIPMETKSECLDALDSGQVDMVVGVIMDKNSPYYSQCTNEISSSSLCLIAPNKTAEYINSGKGNYKYSISYEYGTADYLFISFINASKYIAVANQNQVYNTCIQGDADAMIGIKSSLLYQLKQAGLEDDYSIVYNYMATVKYSILVQKGDEELKRLLNNEIAALHASSSYQNIYNKWMVSEQSMNINIIIKRVVYISIAVIIGVIIYTIFSWQINALLKKQVAEKTQKLQEINKELQLRIRQIENESTLRNLIIENSHSGMILIDKNYLITLANSSACALSGQASIPVGEKIQNVSVFRELLNGRINDIFCDNYCMTNEIVPIVTDGEQKEYRLNINQTMKDGCVSGALLTVEDVTKEEREKRELFEKEKNKALNRIIAGIAHEIKNPLMSIRTFATLIGTKGDDKEFQESFYQFVPGEVDRINKLIESLINYAKPVAKEMECVDVKAIINDCMYLTRPVVKRGIIGIQTEIGDNLIIKVNKDQVKQVLINIFMNGIESMEKKIKTSDNIGKDKLTMRVSAWAEDEYVFISIADEGMGMNTKELRNCTDPFFTTKAAGTGLGLALSKVFIKENKGELFIESMEMEYTKVIIRFRRYCTNESEGFDN